LAVILLVAGLVAGGVFLYITRMSSTTKSTTLSNSTAYSEAVKSYESFPGVSSLSPEDRAKLDAEIKPQYLAGYITGFGPNANEISTAPSSIGTTAAPATISTYIQNIINNKIALAKTTGYYQGYLYYFWFDDSPKPNTDQALATGQPPIADRQYSEQISKEYQKKLADGSIKPQKAAEDLAQDLRLKLFDQANNSGYFVTALTASNGTNLTEEISKLFGETNPGQGESLKRLLATASDPGLTEIGVINAVPGGPASEVKRDIGFVMAYLEVVLKGQDSIDKYQSELNIAKDKLK